MEPDCQSAQRQFERHTERQIVQRALGQFPQSRDQERPFQLGGGHFDSEEEAKHWQQVVGNHKGNAWTHREQREE